MKQLEQAQQEFLAYLEQVQSDKIPSFISHNQAGEINPLEIYKNSILGNHLGAFAEVYPVIEQLVGETFFEHALFQFKQQFPNYHYDISCYGEQFADFLATFEPCKSLPYLVDIAKLEWFCHRACLGKEDPQADFSSLNDLDEQSLNRICFLLPSDSYLLESEFPALDIFEVNQTGYEGSQIVDLDKGGDKLFIWQKGLDLRIERLSEPEFFCLNHFKNQQTLEKMLYYLNSHFKLAERSCQDILSKMIQRGWLVGFNVLE